MELPPRARRILVCAGFLPQGLGTTSACAENTRSDIRYPNTGGNYLRVRGEYAVNLSGKPERVELPPRARRIPGIAYRTPARLWNYLRVRGEYAKLYGLDTPGLELPPRARRIPQRTGIYGHSRGTTSACAENTSSACFLSVSLGNYLRVRGEYRKSRFVSFKRWELPPRARRILIAMAGGIQPHGTTSACAENTNCGQSHHSYSGNYLRVRGEYPK